MYNKNYRHWESGIASKQRIKKTRKTEREKMAKCWKRFLYSFRYVSLRDMLDCQLCLFSTCWLLVVCVFSLLL